MSLEPEFLKHFVEAEKLTFRGELSFQRSECTAGLTVALIFCVDCTDYFVKNQCRKTSNQIK
jgi:hypothetical protein